MANVINMQVMRYINLFERVTGVSTRHCFVYNNNLIFAVPKTKIFVAVGKAGQNMKKIAEILRRKIKVIAIPEGKLFVEKFISDIVEPVTFNKVDMKNSEIIINAGRQSKAALIGRNRAREKELEDILKSFFNIHKLKIT